MPVPAISLAFRQLVNPPGTVRLPAGRRQLFWALCDQSATLLRFSALSGRCGPRWHLSVELPAHTRHCIFPSLSSAGSALHIPVPTLSLSLPLERGQEEDKSDAACACVCKCPRVCLFPPFALIPGCGQPVAQDGRLYLGEENCLPVALPPPLSLCCVQRKKVWTSFYLLFCLLFDSHFTIAIQGRDANIFPALSYSGMLSPVFWASCFVV